MSRVKAGADVRTRADLQHLVTSVILSQDTAFTLDDVTVSVTKMLAGSPLDGVQEPVREMCRRTIMLMELSGGLRGEDGRFCPALPFPSYNRRLTK